MSGFENYKNNLDILDELCLNKLDVHNGVTYNGPKLNEKNKCEVSTIQPLAAAVIGLNNTSASSSSLQNKDDSLTKWSNIDAQEHYLNKKPTCFMILGKPGVNEYLLGEQIAEKFNCIHLCPRNIIDDEIIQQSQTGKCLDFNMRHNNVCTFDMLLKILKKKLNSEVIKHRGYIISGFPMVTTNESEKYLFRRVHGEISMAYCNEFLSDILVEVVKKRAKEKKKKKNRREDAEEEEEEEAKKEDEEEAAEEVEKEEAEEEEDQHIELPEHVLDTCSNIIISVKTHFDTQMVVLTKQFYQLMNLEIQPDIFFYTTCPDADSVALKNKKYVNCVDNSYVCEPLTKKIDLNEPRWPKFYSMFDLHCDNTTLETKYLCKQPNNFKAKAVQQLCNYNNYIYSFIDKTLQGFDPKRIIKLDGRLPLSEMMEQVSEKLFLLNIIPISIPKPLNIESEDLEEFWNTIGETNVFESDSYKFVRSASPWYNRCPVELIKRHTILGKTKYAATFLKYVYLLSTPENFIKFYINPRPYLKMKYLDPICRISVIGSKLSGKSMIASCLSWIFDTNITDVAKITHDESIKKFNRYSLEIFKDNVKSLIDNERRTNWKNLESKRINDLNDWFNEEKKQLKSYVSKFDEFKEIKKNKDDLIIKNEFLEKTLSLLLEDEEDENQEKQNEILTELKSNTNTITELDLLIETTESELHAMEENITYLPFLNELEMCRSLLSDEKQFKQYAPLPLITPTEKPKLPPLIDDEDVKIAIDNHIAQNEDLKKEIEIKTEEVVPEVINILNSFDNDIDERTQQIRYGKWIIDNYPLELDHWVTLSENNLLPDITVTLIEHREEDDDLMNIYTDVQNSVKYPEERYIAANDPLISVTLLRKPSGTSHVKNNKIGEIIWNDLLNRLFPLDFQSDQKEEESVFAKFRENWEAIQLQLEENSKCFIEVEIGNKTDIEVVEEVLLKLRKCYYLPVSSDEEATQEDEEEEVDVPKNMLTYNPPTDSCETMEYCPIAFYKYGVLWKGKVQFNLKFDSKIHYFCDENSKTIFENDVTKYQSLNKPLKNRPALKICVIGRIGNGKSTISKQIAKELGLFHIDFALFLNEYLLPKHYKKVGWKYENIFKDKPFDDEEVTTFEEPEEDEGLNKFPSEEELRLMVYKYFELGVPLYSKYIQKLIQILWFQEPYCTTGFVLDGFPKNQTDVECMIQNFCIPDLIIDLQGDSEDSVKRVASEMYKTWKIQLAEAKRDAKNLLNIENKKRDDFITKTVIGKLIFDDILDNVCASDNIEQISSPIIDADPDGSTDVDSKLFNYYQQLSEEYPVPEDTTEWENADDARERIETRVQSIYEVEDENIETFKDMLQEEKIKTVVVDASTSLHKVLLNVLSILSNLRSRNESFLEQTFIVDNDTAENMLLEGFYLLSNFGRMCPVYIYEHQYCIHNPFKSIQKANEIFTVLNRSYIYYVFGKDNLLKFRNNPLKYILNNSLTNYCEYPLRISIIGPPKSGKSVLTAKLASRYRLMPISKGFALQYIMDYMPWTELALNMTKQLHSGECVNIEHIVQAIQVIALDYRVSSYGFILDGFPETTSEAEKMRKIGLNPLMVFDLGSSKNKILQNSQNEIHLEILKYMPTYSLAFCEHKFAMWNERCESIRDWIKQDCDNLYNIDAEASRWLCLQSAIDNIDSNIPKIHYFLKNENETAISMDVMAISNETFQQRMSNYKTFCPLCFSQNKLRHSGIYKGGKGKILYKNVFYWVCDEHKKVVMKHPHCYLAPKQNITFPEIPVVVSTINVFLVYENGVCIVTYAENLPSQTIIRGDSNFAANYHGKIYLFCSHECLKKFLEKPHLYCDITVFKDIKLLPQLSLKTLPNLGYLEQTVGNVITSACCYVNVMRPKYPGLDIDMSGIILLALYLKIHNPLTSQSYLPLYMKANKTYEARCKLIHDVGLLLRSMDNPLAKYPVCCKGGEVKLTVMKSSSIGVTSFASASGIEEK